MKTKGFTLIELLVVIAIIALLLSIIVPSLKTVKEMASGAACLSNEKQLCLAWTMYHSENNSHLVGGSNYYTGERGTPYRWVEVPLLSDSDNPEKTPRAADADITFQTRLNGIRSGKLFPYTGNEDVYHCPADKTHVKNPEPEAVYRSYAISGLMNGEAFGSRVSGLYSGIKEYWTIPGTSEKLYCVIKYNEIRSPGNKFVFVEERYPGQKYNEGSFVLMRDSRQGWWDYPAVFHNRQSTVGFADCHAEIRKWKDSRTIALINGEKTYPDGTPVSYVQPGNEDLAWMVRGYIPR